jgi:hypothetical protein
LLNTGRASIDRLVSALFLGIDLLETDNDAMLHFSYPILDDFRSDEVKSTKLVIRSKLTPGVERRSGFLQR